MISLDRAAACRSDRAWVSASARLAALVSSRRYCPLWAQQKLTCAPPDSRHGFSGAAGELRYAHAQGNTYIEGDTNGDSFADFMIRLDGMHVVDAADFVV